MAVFNNPDVGQVILQAAQGLSQVFLQQAQLTRRTREFEESQVMKREVQKQRLDLEKLRADRANEQLKLQKEQGARDAERVEISQASEARRAALAPLSQEKLQTEVDLLKGKKRLQDIGGPAKALTETAIKTLFMERHGQLMNSPEFEDQMIALGLENTQDKPQIDNIRNAWAGRASVENVARAKRDALEALRRFGSSAAGPLVGSTGLGGVGARAEQKRLQDDIETLTALETWIGRRRNEITRVEMAQNAPQSSSVPIPAQEAALIGTMIEHSEEVAFDGMGLVESQINKLANTLAAGELDFPRKLLRPHLLGPSGRVDPQKANLVYNWIENSFGDNAREMQIKLKEALDAR